MVNAGRICCITAPFLLSIGVLICMTLVFLGGLYDHNKTLGDLYFLKVDLSNITLGPAANLATGGAVGNSTLLQGALQASKQSGVLKDYYTIYLRTYCSWNANESAYADCTSPETYFWFNPIKVWGLNNTGVPVEQFIPKSLNNGLDLYKGAAKAIFYLYVFALSAAAITLVVGISAIFSRWGSFFTTFCATAMALLTLGASITATAVYVVVKSAINESFKAEGIKSSTGSSILTNTWIGAALAIGAAFFWLLSVCCCSGRSPYNPGNREARRTRVEKTPYTYERVGSPYMGPSNHQSVPLNTLGPQGYAPQTTSAYEPFRPQAV